MRVFLLASCAALAGSGGLPARAQTETAVRVGDHAGFGRVVFDLPDGATYKATLDANQVWLSFQGAGLVTQPLTLPNNVLLVQGGQDTATILLQPGMKGRVFRLDNRLVVDVVERLDHAPPPRSIPAAAPRPPPPPELPTIITVSARREMARPIPLAVRPAGPPTAPAPAPLAEPHASAPVVPVAADPLSAPVASPDTAPIQAAAPTLAPQPTAPPALSFLLQAAPDVGVAAFRRGTMAVVVLDRRLPPQPLPDGGTWIQAAVSTTIRLPLPPPAALRLDRVPAGWMVASVATAQDGTLAPVSSEDGVRLAAPRPAGVATVTDPDTGGILLVGTVLEAAQAAAVGVPRQTPDMALLPTWLGVAVLPVADTVDLRATTRGFVLAGNAPVAAPEGTVQTRRFDFSDIPTAALLNRLRAQQAGAAASDPRARSHERTGAARSMIALGLGAEAQSLLQIVAADDPQAAADVEVTGLAAIAAVLAGRPGEAAGLDDKRLDGTDELAMWRGLRDRRLFRVTDDADRLGRFVPMALSYPAPLRREIWPDVAEAAVEAGVAVPADSLPPFAKALVLDRGNQLDKALAAYAVLADSPDQYDSIRAKARAVELRLAAGRIGPKEASAALNHAAFEWRGDRREMDLRLRAAELQAAGGDWRAALDMLRTAGLAFPDAQDAIRIRKAAVLQSMLAANGAGLSPLDTVLLAGQFGDAVPDGPAGGALARLLADKLMALDLPVRAVPVLQGLMQTAPAGEPRAEFGARLAQLLLDGGAASAAGDALAASEAPDLPTSLVATRSLLQARVKAALGDMAGATAQLFGLGTASADDLRATLLQGAGDWRGSLSALTDLAAKRVPSEGPLSEDAQDVLVRQASAAAQVPDPAALQLLNRSADRLTGPRRELFRVLTEAPVAVSRDLKRAGQDLAAARLVAQRMQAADAR